MNGMARMLMVAAVVAVPVSAQGIQRVAGTDVATENPAGRVAGVGGWLALACAIGFGRGDPTFMAQIFGLSVYFGLALSHSAPVGRASRRRCRRSG